MPRFLVVSPHTAEDCQLAINYFRQYHAGFLTHFEWGCYDNDHTAYAFVDTESHEAAKLAVPPLLRDKARAIEVVHYKPEESSDPLHGNAEPE